MRFLAAIFDMDGTLIDSEPVYFENDRRFLAGYGIGYDEAFYADMVGKGVIEFFRAVEARWPDSPLNALPVGERSRLKDEAYLAFARGRLRAFPAAVELVRAFRARGIPLAVASGSSPEVIRSCLEWTGLLGSFAAIVSASEVARGKPAPDIFLEAARRLGAAPELCLAIEDARHGVRAAKAAGMVCVAAATRLPGVDLHEDFLLADYLEEKGMGELDSADVMAMLGL